MRYIESFREGMHVSDVYLCKNKYTFFSFCTSFGVGITVGEFHEFNT